MADGAEEFSSYHIPASAQRRTRGRRWSLDAGRLEPATLEIYEKGLCSAVYAINSLYKVSTAGAQAYSRNESVLAIIHKAGQVRVGGFHITSLNFFSDVCRQKICDSIEIPILTRCCFCFPLRKGLIAFGYINLILTMVVTVFLSIYLTQARYTADQTEYPRVIADVVGLVIEIVMTATFIVALHKKHVLLMKVYLYFEIVFSAIGFIYSLAFLTRETAGELFVILFQLTLQIYLVILIWSSIVKMERDGTVKYVRDRDPA